MKLAGGGRGKGSLPIVLGGTNCSRLLMFRHLSISEFLALQEGEEGSFGIIIRNNASVIV